MVICTRKKAYFFFFDATIRLFTIRRVNGVYAEFLYEKCERTFEIPTKADLIVKPKYSRVRNGDTKKKKYFLPVFVVWKYVCIYHAWTCTITIDMFLLYFIPCPYPRFVRRQYDYGGECVYRRQVTVRNQLLGWSSKSLGAVARGRAWKSENKFLKTKNRLVVWQQKKKKHKKNFHPKTGKFGRRQKSINGF